MDALVRMMRPRVMPFLFYALFFFSGSAGLGYQMVWSKMLATGLGHEMRAVLAVVAAVMGGMAIGAWTLDGVLSRSSRPWQWYGRLEIFIGLWGLLLTVLIPVTNRSALHLIGLEPSALRHWSVAFGLPFLALFPVTAAMGATLPAMERWLAPLTMSGRCVGAVYSANTLGAVVGTLGGAFVILPSLGLSRSVWLLAAVNALCGVAALLLGARTALSARSARAELSSPDSTGFTRLNSAVRPPFTSARLGLTVFATGLLGIGFEAVGVRVLSQVLENTVYTFAAVLAVFLSGTSIGAALYQRFGRRSNPQWLLTDLLCAVSLACMLGVMATAHAQAFYDRCRAALGDSKLGVLAAEMTVASAVLLMPAIFMGATFSHLVQAARREDGGVGQAAALNTFGGALASVLFGVFLLPLIGSKWTLVLISFGYLMLLPRVTGWRWGFLVAPVVLTFALPANLQVIRVGPGGHVVEHREGVTATVAVVEDANGDRVLRVDNRFQMGGTAAAAAEYRHAHIPLLLHPTSKRALFLGLGTGITFGAASLYPNLQSDGVELVPEILEVMREFEPYNFSPGRQARLRLFAADARRFVRTTDSNYDVIVADLFHPARDGAGSLYTLEHFQAVRGRLAPGGLFCQWLPLHQLDEEVLRLITRTFLEAFPNAQAWLLRFNVDAPVIGLVGTVGRPHYSTQWVEHRLNHSRLESELKKLALADSIRLFGNLLAGPTELRAFAGDAPLNTDDQPRVTFGAPRFAYRTTATPYGRLLELLKFSLRDPRELLGLDSSDDATQFAGRLTKYMTARDAYLNGLVDEAEGRQPRAIDRFVESARLSDDFTSGYAQCLTLASVLARTKPAEARALLERLVEAQPSRPVAREMLERLFPK